MPFISFEYKLQLKNYFESQGSIIGIKKLCKLLTLGTKESNKTFYLTQKNVAGPWE